MDNTLRKISQSLNELDSYDADLRFMALNDLYNVLHEDQGPRQLASQRVLSRVSDGILTALVDTNTEVQNQAVKALGALVVVYEGELKQVLTDVLASKSSARDLALRAILTNTEKSPANAGTIVSLLLPVVCANNNPSIESTDVFLELVKTYSADFGVSDVAAAIASAKSLIVNSSGLVVKRAYDVLLTLAPTSTDEQFQSILQLALDQSSPTSQTRIGALHLLSGLVDQCSSRITTDLVPIARQSCEEISEETIEVSEAGLFLFESLVAHKKTENSDISPLISSCIAYNPNLGDVDDDDDMDETSDFGDDSEIEEDFDDDTEDSWKVRRVGFKVLVAMLQADPDSALQFVPQVVNILKFEPNDAVKKELLWFLELVAKPLKGESKTETGSRARSNSEASMVLNDGVLSEYIDKFVAFAKADPSTPGYLPLFRNLCENYPIDNPDAIVELCLYRIKTYKSKQVLQCVEVTKVIVANFTKFNRENVLRIIEAGLDQPLFKIQSLALEASELLNDLRVLPFVEKIVTQGLGAAIRSAAFDTAGKLLAAHPEDNAIDSYVQLGIETLKSDPERRSATLSSLISLLENPVKISNSIITQLTQQVLDMFSATSRTTTSLCLELLSQITIPESADLVATKVLELPSDSQYIDLKCSVLSRTLNHPGVVDFALEVAQLQDYEEIKSPSSDSPVLPIVALFGKLSLTVPNLLKQVTAVYKETPFWAEIIAEIIVKSDTPTPPIPQPLTTWYVMTALFLTLRGRTVFSSSFDTEGLDPIVAGYCIGASTINLHTSEQLLEAASTSSTEKPAVALSGVEVVILRDTLGPSGYEKAWAAAEYLSKQDLGEAESAILSRIIGALYARTGNSSRFAQWDGSIIGINATKVAFSLAVENSVRLEIVKKFVSQVRAEDITVRAIAAKSLAWAIQIHPSATAPFVTEFFNFALQSTEKDPSLVRSAKIGPYRHEIDDGLDYRKACYELIYLCLSNFPDISVDNDVWVPVLSGLKETEDHDIQVLACLIIEIIATKNIHALVPHLYEIVRLFSKIESLTVKETGIKLEHDKKAAITRQINIARGAIRAEVVAAHISHASISA